MLGPVRIMMIDDSSGDVFLIHEILINSLDAHFEMESHPTLAEGMKQLGEGSFDVVLLDLTLPDSRGIDTFHKLSQAFPSLPVIVMSGVDDLDAVQTIMENGAQDYLVKGEIGSKMLKRSILNTLQRKRLEEGLRLLQKAIDSMQLSVIITDSEGGILYNNAAAEQILGSGLTGQNLRQLLPDAHRLLEDTYFDTSLVRKDGTSVDVRIMADRIAFPNGPSKIVFAILELK